MNDLAFGETLRTLREERREKQADVATVVGISVQSYSTYENGREPPFSVLKALGNHFNVSLSYLLGENHLVSKERLSTSPMTLNLRTPQGEMQLTVSQGFVGTAEVTPDGGVVFSLFPADSEPIGPDEKPDGFVGD